MIGRVTSIFQGAISLFKGFRDLQFSTGRPAHLALGRPGLM